MERLRCLNSSVSSGVCKVSPSSYYHILNSYVYNLKDFVLHCYMGVFFQWKRTVFVLFTCVPNWFKMLILPYFQCYRMVICDLMFLLWYHLTKKSFVYICYMVNKLDCIIYVKIISFIIYIHFCIYLFYIQRYVRCNEISVKVSNSSCDTIAQPGCEDFSIMICYRPNRYVYFRWQPNLIKVLQVLLPYKCTT